MGIIKDVVRVKAGDTKNLQRFIDAVTENFRVLTGDSDQSAATLEDLIAAGIASRRRGGGSGPRIVQTQTQSGVGGPDDLTIPVAVTGLTAVGRFLTINLIWTDPNGALTSYAEIWRSATDDIGTASMVGTTSAFYYDDVVGNDTTYYYWVRVISDAGLEGPYTSSVSASTARDPESTRLALTAQPWVAASYFSLFEVITPTTPVIKGGVSIVFQVQTAGTTGGTEPDWSTEITALGDTVVDGTVTWIAVEAGTAPFVIGTVDGQSVVSITDAVIQDASITSAKIAALAVESANIADAAITNAKIGNTIESTGANPSAGAGWRLSKDGLIEAAAIHIRDTSGNTILASSGALSDGINNAARPESGNLLINPLMQPYNVAWAYAEQGALAGDPNATGGNQTNPLYSIPGLETAYLYQNDALGDPTVGGDRQMLSQLFRVDPGFRYQFSGYIVAINCSCDLWVEWYTSTGTYISGVIVGLSTAGSSVSADAVDLSNYDFHYAFASMPSNAYTARMYFIKRATDNGQTWSIAYISHAMMCVAGADQTLPAAWNDGVTPITAANATTYIADAAVDSLQLAGQAVTIPSGAIQSGSYTQSGLTSNYPVSVTYTSSGNPVMITAGVQFAANSASAVIPVVVLEVAGTGYINHTMILAGTGSGFGQNASIALGYKITPSAGSVTVRLRTVMYYAGQTCTVSGGWLNALEVKR